MPIVALALAALAAYVLFEKAHEKARTGASPGVPGIIDVSPMTGQRQVSIGVGQTLRVNLPADWFLLQSVGSDPSSLPMQPVPSRGIGGQTFQAIMGGRQRMTFARGGSTDTITIDVEVGGYGAGWGGFHYGHPAFGYHRPYREYWNRVRVADPMWRWREQMWRLHRHWEPAWGAPPPPPADPIADVVDPMPAPAPVPDQPVS